jgi:hypothetical protein
MFPRNTDRAPTHHGASKPRTWGSTHERWLAVADLVPDLLHRAARKPNQESGRIMRNHLSAPGGRIGRLACLAMLLAGVLLGGILLQAAGATGLEPSLRETALTPAGVVQPESGTALGYSLTPSTTEPYAVCPPASAGYVECLSIIDPPPVKTASGYRIAGVAQTLEGGGEGGGFDPKELQEAYNIPATGGSTQTVAVVDAYDDPDAEADLQKYREKYKIYYRSGETACTKANGCFKKVNQEGKEEKYPTDKYPTKIEGGKEVLDDWGVEISLDLDMVSAACPECHILLVEANSTELNKKDEPVNMFIAEEEAEKLEAGGKKLATEISNSWGEGEQSGEVEDNKYFEDAGVPITVAAGDRAYGAGYPAAAPHVISVGGTTLRKKAEGSRKWEESVWLDTGGGCSMYEPKPAWQTDPDCSKRTDNDVAAVANNDESPVSVYDSYEYEEAGVGTGKLGWVLLGGTSVGTPIVAAVEAHASEPVKKEGPEAFYQHQLFNVTVGGDNGACHTYLCIAEPGYNGPTGWGTPDGPLELEAGYHAVTTAATDVTSIGATLNGYLNTPKTETVYYFEYGKTTAYGTSAPVPSAEAATSALWKGVDQSVTGLEPNTTYHYRLVATNKSSGTTYGEDRTLLTSGFEAEVLPKPSGSSEEHEAYGESCISQTCVAVGSYWNEPAKALDTLVESLTGASWSVQSTPNPTGTKESKLTGVSCSSSTACTAVGYYKNSSGAKMPLAERLKGTEWTLQEPKIPTGAKSGRLTGVSCASSEACTAVGDYVNSSGVEAPLAERLKGTEWTLQEPKIPTGAKSSELAGVSCTSPEACTAVGYYVNSEGTKGVEIPLAERLKGTEWTLQEPKIPTEAIESTLRGVSCASSEACTAVGFYYVKAKGRGAFETEHRALAERWNGTEWSVQTTPRPSGATSEDEDWLYGVSCTSSTACTAVGAYEQGGIEAFGNEEALGEQWNGTTWTVVGMPALPTSVYWWRASWQNAVSCAELTGCVAVGDQLSALEGSLAPEVAFAERQLIPPIVTTEAASGVTPSEAILNGTVNPRGYATGYYFEYGPTTSYGSKTSEASAGSGAGGVKVSQTLTGLTPGVYHFRIIATSSGGTSYGADQVFTTEWTIQSTPNPSGATSSGLGGTSCTSSNACTAVGSYKNSSGKEVTLAERWNGTEWTIQATPGAPEGVEYNGLAGVSCSSSEACTAVGHAKSGSETTLAERWNGKEWSAQSMPAASGAHLSGVSCASSAACTAVGVEGEDLLVEGWNGVGWSIQEAPSPTGAKFFTEPKVSCTSASACTLVGGYETSLGTYVTLAERWNGTKWSLEATPNPAEAKDSFLRGVSCVSSEACTAVGEYETTSRAVALFAESWNGKEWTVQKVPDPAGKSSTSIHLFGVSCTSTAFCAAVGLSETATLAEGWNGKEWLVQQTPNPTGALKDSLGGVSCASSTACVAAGYYENSSKADVTLAERYQ